MPNYCENELEVKGSQKIVDIFVRVAKGHGRHDENEPRELDFEQFIPYPPCLENKELEKELGTDGYNGYGLSDDIQDGYDWCHKNWSTKWNAGEVSVSLGKGKAHYSFDTAWCPPEAIIVEMSKIFKTLTFTLKFWEMGVGFRGVFKAKDGKVLLNNTYEYRGNRGG